MTEDGSGLGNLIIGFKDLDWEENSEPNSCDENVFCPVRTGSHNLVFGADHSFTASGSVLVGKKNASYNNSNFLAGRLTSAGALGETYGWLASITGGEHNVAWGQSSAILGGLFNVTGSEVDTDSSSGYVATISGGSSKTAIDFGCTVGDDGTDC